MRLYLWVDSEPIAQLQHGPALQTEELLYLHVDHLKTPRLATDPTEALLWRLDAETFGAGKPERDPDADEAVTNVRLRMPGQYVDGESGLIYNWNRYYDPRTGRYISFDPIGIVPGVGASPSLPKEITRYLRSVPIKERLLHGLNQPYAYVDNRPLTLIDPFGLYGTSSCSYYQQRCQEVGGVYYCSLAPAVCKSTPDNSWSKCVRQCLQEYDWGYCKPNDECNTGRGSDVACIVNIHQMCWQECIGGGPPRPEAGPPEY